jgi:hypothetical protein
MLGKRRGGNIVVFSVGADLRICPRDDANTESGADTQVCPYIMADYFCVSAYAIAIAQSG